MSVSSLSCFARSVCRLSAVCVLRTSLLGSARLAAAGDLQANVVWRVEGRSDALIARVCALNGAAALLVYRAVARARRRLVVWRVLCVCLSAVLAGFLGLLWAGLLLLVLAPACRLILCDFPWF